MRRRPTASAGIGFALGALIALGAIGIAPQPVAAGGDQLQEKGLSTYELQPSQHRIHVTVQFTLTNKAPSKARSYDCSYWAYSYWGTYWVPATCTGHTNYYYNTYSFYTEKDAQNLKVKANSGSASVKKGKVDGDWRLNKISYSALWYGKTRVLTVTYDLPAHGPRSDGGRIAAVGYADFCGWGPGTDKGEVRLVVPSGYKMVITGAMTSRESGGRTTWTSGALKAKPWTFKGCLEGANADGFNAVPTSIDGGGTITVESWKDDTTWASTAQAAADDLAAMAGVLGTEGLPAAMTIREKSINESGGTGFDAKTGVFTASEFTLDASAIRTDFAVAAWFPIDTWTRGWIRDGYLAWAGYQAGLNVPCDEPGAYPVSSAHPDLSIWTKPGVGAGATDTAIWAWKQEAACYMVRTVNEAAGADGTAAILAALRNGTDAYSPADAPVTRPIKPATWQDWLDIVTERGLIPAGADPKLASALLVTYGVTDDQATLDAHAAARDAFHGWATLTGAAAPSFIIDAMGALDDATPVAALASASAAWKTAADTEAVMPEVPANGGVVRTAVLAATSQADLDAAVALSTAQLAAAKDVTDAFAVEAAPRDTMTQIGLLGVVLPSHDAAIAAVVKGDPAAAKTEADAIRASITGAASVGTTRVAMAGGGLVVVLVLLVVVVFLVRRRSRRRGIAAAAAGASMGAAGVAPSVAYAPPPAHVAVEPASPPPAYAPTPVPVEPAPPAYAPPMIKVVNLVSVIIAPVVVVYKEISIGTVIAGVILMAALAWAVMQSKRDVGAGI